MSASLPDPSESSDLGAEDVADAAPLSQRLPVFLDRWLSEAFEDPIPSERKANCADCVMCSPRETLVSRRPFHPDVKCCTYTPDLRNFLVGAILADTSEGGQRGRASVRKRLDNAIGVSPLGLSQPPSYHLTYTTATKEGAEAFGRSTRLKCPHFVDADGGQCAIWQHRNAVCATYFCKHNRGATGHTFWKDLRRMLSHIELSVALWCALRVGVDARHLRRVLMGQPPGATTTLNEELIAERTLRRQQLIWGAWHSRKEDFFIACSKAAETLAWSDIKTIGGSLLEAHLVTVRDSLRALHSDTIPSHLQVAQIKTRPLDGTMSSVETYSSTDGLVTSQRVLRVLHYFDGRSTDEALASIQSAENTVLSPDLLRALVDYQLLREA